MFCAHEWKLEEALVSISKRYGLSSIKDRKVSATCTKCGWHRTYWKFFSGSESNP